MYFTSTIRSPLERHLCVAALEPGRDIVTITAAPGMHAVRLDAQCRRFVTVSHSIAVPPRVALVDAARGVEEREIYREEHPLLSRLRTAQPELISFSTRDGARLDGALWQPPARFGTGPFPTVVSVYGGPHAQLVTNGWGLTASMRAQYLAERGFVVFSINNRGSYRRGAHLSELYGVIWETSKCAIR
ncbi:MAG: hypothetical protein M1118_05005 [Chloroflexi bacterium]|nr:hypothetical protein [Chloroflexota bacterium]